MGLAQCMNQFWSEGLSSCMCACLSSARGALDGFQCSYSIFPACHDINLVTQKNKQTNMEGSVGKTEK